MWSKRAYDLFRSCRYCGAEDSLGYVLAGATLGALAGAALAVRAAAADPPPPPPPPPDDGAGNGVEADTPRPCPLELRIEISRTHYGRWRATVRSADGDLVAGTSNRDRTRVIMFVIDTLTGGIGGAR